MFRDLTLKFAAAAKGATLCAALIGSVLAASALTASPAMADAFDRLEPGDAYLFTSNRPDLPQIVRVYRGLVGDEHVWEIYRSVEAARRGAEPWRTYWRDLDGRLIRSREGNIVIGWSPHDCAAVEGPCEFEFRGEDGRTRLFRRVSEYRDGAWFHELYNLTGRREVFIQEGAAERDEDGVFTYHQIQVRDGEETVFQLQDRLRL